MGQPRCPARVGSTRVSGQKQGVKAGRCVGRLSEGPDFRDPPPFPHHCSQRLLSPSSEQQAQQHATLAISRSHRCGAGSCRHPWQPPPPTLQTYPCGLC